MTRAPGPKGGLIWGSFAQFKANPLGLMLSGARDHGDVVRFRLGPFTAHLVNHPDLIDHVLSRGSANYDKATRSATRIAATTGDSLLSADGVAWGRHRRLVQPAFQPRCFDGIGPVIDDAIAPMLDRWHKTGRIDIVDEMMQLLISVTIKILFSANIAPAHIMNPLRTALADTWRRIEAPLDPSMISRRLHRRAFRNAVAQIDAIVLDLIRTRRASQNRPDDVLTRLLTAHETAAEMQLSDAELRDAAVTLLLSGHETTANALAWAFIHAANGFETADPAHIFAETIRLHPSIWVIERHAIQADKIGGYHIPRGSSVLVSPYVLHRRADFWPNPDEFNPARFANDPPRLRDGYLPYGVGQHRCIGLYLANTMAQRIIAGVFAQTRLALEPDQKPSHIAGITLSHHAPVMMRVTS